MLRAIFSVFFFTLFLHQCIHRDQDPESSQAFFIMWKCPKNGRKVEIRSKMGYSTKCRGTIFSVLFFTFFSSSMYSQRPYHNSTQNRLFLLMSWRHFFFYFFTLCFLHQCIYRDHTQSNCSIYHFLICESLQKRPLSHALAKNPSDVPTH